MFIIAFVSGQYIAQIMMYIELQPDYKCSLTNDFKDEFSCVPRKSKQSGDLPQFCDTTLFYKVDWDSESSLDNWYVQQNMECISKARIGLIGSAYFIGWAFAAVFIPRLSDLLGRKVTFLFSMALQLCAFFALYFSRNVNLTTVCMFFFGMAAVGRCSISYLFMMELLPTNMQTLAGTILQVNNNLVSVIATVYFWYISKNWLWIELFAGGLNILCMVTCMLVFPETPKYLITK